MSSNSVLNKTKTEEYDIVILGTGFKECLLFGMLSSCQLEGENSEDNKKNPRIVLISEDKIFRCNNISFSYQDLLKSKTRLSLSGERPSKVITKEDKTLKEFEITSEWHIDLTPKVFLSKERMKTYIKYFLQLEEIQLKSLDGYFLSKIEDSLFTKGRNVLYKIPTSNTDFMSISNQHLQKFIKDSLGGDLQNQIKSFNSGTDNKSSGTRLSNDAEDSNNLNNEIFGDAIKNYRLDRVNSEIVGRGMCFYDSDNYINEKTVDIIEKFKFYFSSCEDKRNPFYYPMEGLGSIAEAFCMIGAYNGGEIKLNAEGRGIFYDSNKKFQHIVLSDGSIIKGKYLIVEPSIAMKMGVERKVIETHKTLFKSVNITNKPISKMKGANGCIVILPNCFNDTYITMVNNNYQICKNGYHVAVCSALIEARSDGTEEIKQANEIVGNVLERFNFRLPYYERIVPEKEKESNNENNKEESFEDLNKEEEK
ncbi:MAG: hypothetical protein MJ252_11960, partial [archaeon]|nr:hypothetical protein [archaeon]